MSFQYTYDANGKPVGVFVPIQEWEKLTTEIKKKKSNTKSEKSKIFKSVTKGLWEVQQIKEGKIKSIPLKQLLDEL